MADAKTCTRCGQSKPLAEFAPQERGLHGVTSKCRPCERLRGKEYRQRYPDRVQARNRAYAKSPGGRKVNAAKAKRYRERHPERCREVMLRYDQRNPDRVMARMMVWWHVKTGRLPHATTLTCHDCGGQARERDHHLGYEQEHWLHTQPVCRPCHAARTRARR